MPLSAASGAAASVPSQTSAPEPQTSDSTEIGRFAPRRSLLPLLVGVIGVAVAVLLGYTALRPPTPNPTASAPVSATPKPTPRDGTRFTAESDRASGVWKITDSRWDATGVSALITVTVDTGTLDCYFSALPHDGSDVSDGEESSLSPQFPNGPISAGSSASGWVHFTIEHGTTLVFLRTADQAQISGLEVAG
ncbi:MAG: hypothetical protein CVT62_12300 [Actinobacteria bacterium HGW-Actinobacteria-2]|nr:MAG: hypothetical protein CVT62_12300 [Actinobacteria bacterium HGW-Actinobacteria-2]